MRFLKLFTYGMIPLKDTHKVTKASVLFIDIKEWNMYGHGRLFL